MVLERAQTMIHIQIQKMSHIGKPVEVRRMRLRARSTESSHLVVNQTEKLQETDKERKIIGAQSTGSTHLAASQTEKLLETDKKRKPIGAQSTGSSHLVTSRIEKL